MEFNTKINRIKLALFIGYIITLFLPIYSKTINNVTYKASVFDLNAGIFFIILFVVLIIATIVVYFLQNKYFDYVYLGTLVLMGILLVLLFFMKEPSSSIRFTFFLQFIIIVLIALAQYLEEFTIVLYEKTKELIIFISIKIKDFLIFAFNKSKEGVNALIKKIKEKKEEKEQAEEVQVMEQPKVNEETVATVEPFITEDPVSEVVEETELHDEPEKKEVVE